MSFPTIPEYITVHLGNPDDPTAKNVQVPFIDYIKNVASSEIYPTWPESAIRANIYAQITFALNRIYTEWYRSRGYDFDITSSTQFDQKYIEGRDIFSNISKIVDDVFNDYVVRQGFVQPLFTQYCNGTTSTCDGLSQWGTVDLANDGLTPYEILQYYYGDNINIVFNAPTQQKLPSYPGIPLKLGSSNEEVRTLKKQLNRIGKNYPAIRPVLETTSFYDVDTENAVKKFQQIFNLEEDGIVGKATWYKIKNIYNGVKGLGELKSEGLTPEEVERIDAYSLKLGDIGYYVKILQYYLSVISYFNPNIRMPSGNSEFDKQTEDSVKDIQNQYGLTVDGIVGRDTWNAILRSYENIIATIPPEYFDVSYEIYPGRYLSIGQSGEDVTALQNFIVKASKNFSYIPQIEVTGVYDQATADAVKVIQQNAGLPVNGVTGALTWDTIVNLSKSS